MFTVFTKVKFRLVIRYVYDEIVEVTLEDRFYSVMGERF